MFIYVEVCTSIYTTQINPKQKAYYNLIKSELVK